MALINCQECKKEVSSKAKTCPNCGAKPQSSKIVKWGGGLLLAMFILPAAIGAGSGGGSGSSYSPAPNPKTAAINSVQLDFSGSKGGFGSIMMMDFTLKNTGSAAVKDIEITCTNIGNSGTRLGDNSKTVYEIVEPGKTKKIREVNMGFVDQQASKAACEIVDLTVL